MTQRKENTSIDEPKSSTNNTETEIITTCIKSADLTCLMLKLDTDMIIVGLLEISSGRTQREKMAFCLGDSASFPVLSLVRRMKNTESDLRTT